jgi:hypothetical protein
MARCSKIELVFLQVSTLRQLCQTTEGDPAWCNFAAFPSADGLLGDTNRNCQLMLVELQSLLPKGSDLDRDFICARPH